MYKVEYEKHVGQAHQPPYKNGQVIPISYLTDDEAHAIRHCSQINEPCKAILQEMHDDICMYDYTEENAKYSKVTSVDFLNVMNED